MNRRAFLTAVGAVAVQQKLETVRLRAFETNSRQSTITTSRFPYVQNVGNHRASILWATYEAGSGLVQYSPDGVNFNDVAATSRLFSAADTGLSASFVQYQADLTGLTPNTNYLYRVAVDARGI